MDGRRKMLPWTVGDEDDEHLSFFEYARAKHANTFMLVAFHKEKGICLRACKYVFLHEIYNANYYMPTFGVHR